MSKIKTNDRDIPLRNYVFLFIILIITFSLLFLFSNIFSNSNLNSPIMNRYLPIINYNELSDYVIENKNVIIYTSILNDEKTREFEIKFRSIINSYDLSDDILYLDLTNIDKKAAKKLYSINGISITSTPNILIFKDSKLIDIYSIKNNNYDIKKLVDYLKDKEVIED